MKEKIFFLGGGNITQALVGNLLLKKVFAPDDLLVNDILPERCKFLRRKFGIKATTDKSMLKLANVIIVAVKPQQIETALKEIQPLVEKKHLIISVAAGITISYLRKMLSSGENPDPKIIRTMPNTPVAVGAGLIAMSFGKGINSESKKIAQKIFSSCGQVIIVKENQLDAITAISGSGPGYFLYFADCFQRIAQKIGLKKFAEQLVRQTIYGTGMMVKEMPESFNVLLQKVMSPGGTTEAAVKYLKEKRLIDIFQKAVFAARNRAKELRRC